MEIVFPTEISQSNDKQFEDFENGSPSPATTCCAGFSRCSFSTVMSSGTSNIPHAGKRSFWDFSTDDDGCEDEEEFDDFSSETSSTCSDDTDDGSQQFKRRRSDSLACDDTMQMVPAEPPSLSPTSFECNQSLASIYGAIENYLENCGRNDCGGFTFDRSFYVYKIRCKSSTLQCHAAVAIYRANNSENHVIECVFRDGDRFLFCEMYQDLKRALLHPTDSAVFDLAGDDASNFVDISDFDFDVNETACVPAAF